MVNTSSAINIVPNTTTAITANKTFFNNKTDISTKLLNFINSIRPFFFFRAHLFNFFFSSSFIFTPAS